MGNIPASFIIVNQNEENCRVVLETKTIEGLKQSVEWLKGV